MEVGGRKQRPHVRIRREFPLTDWDTSDTTPVSTRADMAAGGQGKAQRLNLNA